MLLTLADVREIATTVSFSHAEFCIDQEATQIGNDSAAPLYAELDRLAQESNAARNAELDRIVC